MDGVIDYRKMLRLRYLKNKEIMQQTNEVYAIDF